MSVFFNSKYRDLKAYVPGEQPKDMQYIKLNTNESPYPPSKKVLDAISLAEVSNLNLYPDPDCGQLKKSIAGLFGVEKENVYVANGSDDILNFFFMGFCDGGVVFPDISYGFYKVYAKLHGARYEQIPLMKDFSINPEDYINKGKNVVIANPNAPTGLAIGVEWIEKICASNKGHAVLVDEAYVDFGGESAISLTKKYDNLIVVSTFSKSRSMAGARLGFAIANKEIISDFEKLKFSTNPYSINRLTLLAGTAAIEDNEYYMENCRKIMKTREYTVECLESIGFEILPSRANFIFATCKKISAKELYEILKKKGILVRYFDDEKIRDYIRITIGTTNQMEKLVSAVKDIVEVK